jgi:ribose transport system permease protein
MERTPTGDLAARATSGSASSRKERARQMAIKWGPLLALIVLCIIISILNPRFLSVRNFRAIAKQSSILLILSMGSAFIILMGSIDLSIEGLMAISSVLVSFLVLNNRTSLDLGLLGVLLAVAASTSLGLVNGVVHTKARIPSFMATLGMLSIGVGLATWLYGGYAARILDPTLSSWAKGYLGGVPRLAIIALVLFAVAIFIERYTRLGRYAFAIGGGEDLAKLSGIPVDKYKIIVFTLAGFFYGVAGVLNAARIGAGTARVGEYLFMAITSVVVGGTALTGGVGGMVQTLIGVLIVTVITNGMILLGVHDYIQITVHGLIITGAVILTIDRSKLPVIK